MCILSKLTDDAYTEEWKKAAGLVLQADHSFDSRATFACDHHASCTLEHLDQKVESFWQDSKELTASCCRVTVVIAPLSQASQIPVGGGIRIPRCDLLSKCVPDHSLPMVASEGMLMKAENGERNSLGGEEKRNAESMCMDPESSSKGMYNDACSGTRGTGDGKESFYLMSITDGFQAQALRDSVEVADSIVPGEESATQEVEELVVNSSQRAGDTAQGLLACSFKDHVEASSIRARDGLTGEAPDTSCNSPEMTTEGAERTTISLKESTRVIQQESSIAVVTDPKAANTFISMGNGGMDLAGLFSNAKGSKLETKMEDQHHVIPSVFKSNVVPQEGSVVVPVDTQATNTSVTLGNGGTDLAEFFTNAKGSKCETEMEGWDYIVPSVFKPPPKSRAFMESPRSLRMLLLSGGNMAPTSNDKVSSRIAPVTQSNVHKDHAEHNLSDKQFDAEENIQLMSAAGLSGPIALSGALTYQGLNSYSGPIPYSGSISHRSDSSASTRSFAFPILASDWNISSPVKMGAPDPRFFQQPKKRCFWFCCGRRPSTLFD